MIRRLLQKLLTFHESLLYYEFNLPRSPLREVLDQVVAISWNIGILVIIVG